MGRKASPLAGGPANLKRMLADVHEVRVAAQAAAAQGSPFAPVVAALRLEAELEGKIADLAKAEAPPQKVQTIEEIVKGLIGSIDNVPDILLEDLAVALGEHFGDMTLFSRRA